MVATPRIKTYKERWGDEMSADSNGHGCLYDLKINTYGKGVVSYPLFDEL